MAYLSDDEIKKLGLDTDAQHVSSASSGYLPSSKIKELGLEDKAEPSVAQQYSIGTGAESLGNAISNIPASTAKFLKGAWDMVAHPVQTIEGVADIAAGAISKVLPESIVKDVGLQKQQAAKFDEFTNIIKERYGSIEAAKNTFETDPVGFASEISSVLYGGGKLLTKAGTRAAKIGTAAMEAGQAINPMNAFISAGGKILEIPKKITPTAFIRREYQKKAGSKFAQEGRALEQQTGIDLTPAQETGSKFLNLAESTARKAGQTADQIHANDIKQANQAIKKVNDIMDSISSGVKSAEQVGLDIQNTVNDAISSVQKLRRAQADMDYGAVRTIAGNTPVVKFKSLSDELRNIISEYDVPGAENIAKQTKALLAQIGGKTGKAGSYKLNEIDINRAMNMRQVYSQAARGTGQIFKDIDYGQNRMLASRLLSAMEADFEAAPSSFGKGAIADALKEANKNYKRYSQHIDAIENSVLGKILGKDTFDPLTGRNINSIAPEKIASKIVSLQPSELKTARVILQSKSPDTWNAIKRYSIENALAKAMDIAPSAGMQPVPLSSSKFISKLPGQEHMKILFNPSELSEIEAVKNALLRVGDRSAINTSGTAITADFLSMLTPSGLAKAGAKTLGLKTIANAMTTAEGRKALRVLASPKPYPNAAKTNAYHTVSKYVLEADERVENKEYTSNPDPLSLRSEVSTEAPPMPDAQKSPDGKWYVKREGRYFLVE